MRTIRNTLAVLGLLAVAGGCRDTVELPEPSFFTATIDGSTFQANYYVDFAIADYHAASQRLRIVGLQVFADYSGREIGIVIPTFTGPGTYALGAPSDEGASAYLYTAADVRVPLDVRAATDIQYTTLAPADGSITIAEYDAERGRITGTFSFTATRTDDATQTVTVASGSFLGNVVPAED